MKREYRWMLLMPAAASVTSVSAGAPTDLEQKVSNTANWASQAAGYANQRRSDLRQINYCDLAHHTTLAGALFVFALPDGIIANASATAAARR